MERTAATTEELLTRIRDLFGDEPAGIIDYLHMENRILREILGSGRLRFSPHQRSRLALAGYTIRHRLAEFATVARPETILGWYRALKRGKWDYTHRRNPGGRPRTEVDTVTLVLRMADENSWGADRIVGELRKLGHFIDDNTVTRILRDHGYPTGPQRRGMSWREFIAAHMDTTWATDMFTEEILTRGGLVTVYVLFFIHLATRRVHIAGCTPHPDTEWMKQQARQFTWNVRSPVDQKSDTDRRPRCRFVIHDRDTSFLPLDGILRSEGIEPIRTPVRAPKANAFAERFVREARETLDNLIIVGESRMYRVLKKIEHHHNEHRPHQGIDNQVPSGYDYPQEPAMPEDVRCSSQLGGLLRHYYVDREAA